MMTIRTLFLVILAALVLASCTSSHGIKSSASGVNPEHYGTVAELEERVGALEVGMEQDTVFEILKISEETPNLARLDELEISMIVTNRTKPITDYSGYRLPFVKTVGKKHLESPFETVETKFGWRVSVLLLFEVGRLLFEPRVAGTPRVEEPDSDYIYWDLLYGTLYSVPRRAFSVF